jgi:hypothetical protein
MVPSRGSAAASKRKAKIRPVCPAVAPTWRRIFLRKELVAGLWFTITPLARPSKRQKRHDQLLTDTALGSAKLRHACEAVGALARYDARKVPRSPLRGPHRRRLSVRFCPNRAMTPKKETLPPSSSRMGVAIVNCVTPVGLKCQLS